jgi:hypothetical protein
MTATRRQIAHAAARWNDSQCERALARKRYEDSRHFRRNAEQAREYADYEDE